MKIVIIGGVAGGATAAARLRRLSEKYEITIIEKYGDISYANCGLPYYIGGLVKDINKLKVSSARDMRAKYNIDVRVNSEAIQIDPIKKTVEVKEAGGKTYPQPYDKLILSCGAKPFVPQIEGLQEAENAFTLRSLADAHRIKEYIDNNNVKTAVVAGGGFIGVEAAENLKNLGLEVYLIEKMPQVLRQFDFEMAQIIHKKLIGGGVNLKLNTTIERFEDKGNTAVLSGGEKINSQLNLLALGVVPESSLAEKAGFALGKNRHVAVDKTFNVIDAATKKPNQDVYAIGDMIEVVNFLDDTPYAVPLAWAANRQGRLVADAIAGIDIKPSKIIGVSVVKVFDTTAASAGANEETLKSKNIDYHAVHMHRLNHPEYYPGASYISFKMLFDKKSGRIYGIQAIGKEGTEKRVDVVATVMRLGGTVLDLPDLEVCYAPPYSSAKDPVNILGYIAENIMRGRYKNFYHNQVDEIAKNGGTIIDVRSDREFRAGGIKGSINIGLDELREKIKKL